MSSCTDCGLKTRTNQNSMTRSRQLAPAFWPGKMLGLTCMLATALPFAARCTQFAPGSGQAFSAASGTLHGIRLAGCNSRFLIPKAVLLAQLRTVLDPDLPNKKVEGCPGEGPWPRLTKHCNVVSGVGEPVVRLSSVL